MQSKFVLTPSPFRRHPFTSHRDSLCRDSVLPPTVTDVAGTPSYPPTGFTLPGLNLTSHWDSILPPILTPVLPGLLPYTSLPFPSAEITKDSASEGNFSEDDYLDGRRGARGHHQHHGMSRSHPDRGRVPILPHERGRIDHHQHPQRRERGDDRDQYYMESRGEPRSRHGDRGYRGAGYGGPRALAHHGSGPPGRDKRTRWFVALFDYDPTTMSPNPDACEEELPFSEGDAIKVYGEKDADGFYWGESKGRRGYVPHNMVVEVQELPKVFKESTPHRKKSSGVTSDDLVGQSPLEMIQSSKKETISVMLSLEVLQSNVEPTRGQHLHSRDRWGDIYANMPVKKMIALYDYDPQELSPNVDAEECVRTTFIVQVNIKITIQKDYVTSHAISGHLWFDDQPHLLTLSRPWQSVPEEHLGVMSE
uniref:(California timema) hypothetical protein n=1 Tax=Timema californicum TaxID=61474 RepID=A0A7R9PBJ1_TIMCA|nr:unnamed protein product [Timema californicum]